MKDSNLNKQKQNEPSESQVIQHRRQKAAFLTENNIPLFPNTFRKIDDISIIVDDNDHLSGEELEELTRVHALAGRIMSLRSFGKVTFIHIQDYSARIQVFVQRDSLGRDNYQMFKKYDIGDIVGIKGTLFRTKTGELTVKADSVQLLAKSMRPLPEKYHGLKDVETRYRQRYVDLLVNPQARQIFTTRTRIVRHLRNFLDSKGFLEVETPMMQAIPGGATAKPFQTHHNALDMKLYLRVAPELYLKRLLVGGFEKVYEINRNFRNEGISTQHNPEFTMLEFYWAYVDFKDLMSITEEMFSTLAQSMFDSTQITYQGNTIDLTPPWTKLSFYESLEKIGGLSKDDYMDIEKASELVKKLGDNVQTGEKLGKIQAKLFDILVEPKLIQPHFIYHYPTDISPLSRKNDNDSTITDRFELFITGREIANAFSELNDPVDQKTRFEEQVQEKEAGDDEAHFMDEDYVRALEYAMPPAGGEGIGIDRLVMLFTDSASIREVILFPLLRPEVTSG
ncbi:MAG: lysine--tRNA ligase [Desulfonatronovibrio sp.]|nr:lysine--tRNA ligase [Desulfovibrionales bacterium]